MRYCENCGAEIKDEEEFCEECGAKIDKQAATDSVSEKKS